MSKNIKRIIIFTVICGVFNWVLPSTMSVGVEKAYAYSDSQLNNLKISSGVSGIPIYSSVSYKSDYKIKTGDKFPEVSYSKITSDMTNVKISTLEAKASDIRVFVGSQKQKLTDIYSQINISQGEKKSIYIRLYDSKNSADNGYTKEYELIVERAVGDASDSTTDESVNIKQYDDIYLDSLTAYYKTQNVNQTVNFTFDKAKPVYDINVDESVSYITVKAVPEQQSYKLRVNDKEIDKKGDDKYKEEISLDKGKNIVKIRLVDDGKRREYFLNITRGTNTAASTSSGSTDNNNTATQGTATTTNNTTTQTPAIPQTGGGYWQYKNTDGTIATGWKMLAGKWYYFDTNGAMKTGWIKDASGKWYYLQASGVMAKNSKIDGYKVGADGAWVK